MWLFAIFAMIGVFRNANQSRWSGCARNVRSLFFLFHPVVTDVSRLITTVACWDASSASPLKTYQIPRDAIASHTLDHNITSHKNPTEKLCTYAIGAQTVVAYVWISMSVSHVRASLVWNTKSKQNTQKPQEIVLLYLKKIENCFVIFCNKIHICISNLSYKNKELFQNLSV